MTEGQESNWVPSANIWKTSDSYRIGPRSLGSEVHYLDGGFFCWNIKQYYITRASIFLVQFHLSGMERLWGGV